MAQYRAPTWVWLLLIVALLFTFGRCGDADHNASDHGVIAEFRTTGAAP